MLYLCKILYKTINYFSGFILRLYLSLFKFYKNSKCNKDFFLYCIIYLQEYITNNISRKKLVCLFQLKAYIDYIIPWVWNILVGKIISYPQSKFFTILRNPLKITKLKYTKIIKNYENSYFLFFSYFLCLKIDLRGCGTKE